MAIEVAATTWVYVLVQNPGADEKIVGQIDPEKEITFIPAYVDKESAQQGIFEMPKKSGQKYEIQAIIYEDLEQYAGEAQSLIFFLDADGKIIEKRAPGQSKH